MKIYPTKELQFKLRNNQEETLKRLKRRTEKSKNLSSSHTDKSFRGIINQNEFKIISSVIGTGAFCVMKGSIESDHGKVKAEVHKVFRFLLITFYILPIIAISSIEEFSLTMILVILGQIIIIRFVIIGLAFNFLSKMSLNRLRDVLDIEWVKTKNNN